MYSIIVMFSKRIKGQKGSNGQQNQIASSVSPNTPYSPIALVRNIVVNEPSIHIVMISNIVPSFGVEPKSIVFQTIALTTLSYEGIAACVLFGQSTI